MISNDLRGNPDFDSFYYFDFETDGSVVLDVGILHRNSYSCVSFAEFLDLLQKTRDGTFVAHYGANFDFLFLVKPLIELGFDITYGVSGSKGIALFCSKGKQNLRFIDSYSCTLASLKKLGETFNTQFKKVSIDVLPSELKKSDPTLYYKYLEHDVRCLAEGYKLFMDQFSNYRLGKNPPLTIASLAMKVFKNTLTRPIMTSSGSTRQWERDSYFGGICHLETSGVHSVKVYDVNSMYPHVMVVNEYPTSYVGSWVDKLSGLGLYEVEYGAYSGLPWVFTVDGRLDRNGGIAILDNQSVEYLSKLTRVRVLRGYCYRRSGNLFSYYTDLYKQRVEAKLSGDESKAYSLKILMNSLYGKFGQKDVRRVIAASTPGVRAELYKANIPFVLSEDTAILAYDKPEFQRNAFPAIASFVTLNARRLLRQLSEGVPVIYADTDSLHVPSSESLDTSDELGGLKLEYEGEGIYLGKKLYSLENSKIVSKGVPKGLLTVSNFSDLVSGRIDSIAVEFTSMPTVRDVLINSRPPGIPLSKTRTIRRLA